MKIQFVKPHTRKYYKKKPRIVEAKLVKPHFRKTPPWTIDEEIIEQAKKIGIDPFFAPILRLSPKQVKNAFIFAKASYSCRDVFGTKEISRIRIVPKDALCLKNAFPRFKKEFKWKDFLDTKAGKAWKTYQEKVLGKVWTLEELERL